MDEKQNPRASDYCWKLEINLKGYYKMLILRALSPHTNSIEFVRLCANDWLSEVYIVSGVKESREQHKSLLFSLTCYVHFSLYFISRLIYLSVHIFQLTEHLSLWDSHYITISPATTEFNWKKMGWGLHNWCEASHGMPSLR